jgi:hypothetical protein
LPEKFFAEIVDTRITKSARVVLRQQGRFLEGNKMEIYTDKNGIEITVGSIVRAKGSTIDRRVDVIWDVVAGEKHIHTQRLDGSRVSSEQWHKPNTLEVIFEAVNA